MDTVTRIRAIDPTITEDQARDLVPFLEPYGSYCARRAEELAAEQEAVEADGIDYELVLICKECKGTGTREFQTGRYWADYETVPCCFCDGTGAVERYPIGVGVGLPPAA